jgi:hypothetical protein
MFVTGIPHLGLGFFSAASMLVVIPTGVQIFAWLATMASGRPRLDLPMLCVLGFFAIFVIGGLTGVMVAVVPFDWQVHDTHFVVAHLHYVLVGGFVFPVIAGAYYWLPHVSGRRAAIDLGRPAFWLIFGGFNLTFFQMHLTGLLGMPRRVHTYAAEMGWDGLNSSPPSAASSRRSASPCSRSTSSSISASGPASGAIPGGPTPSNGRSRFRPRATPSRRCRRCGAARRSTTTGLSERASRPEKAISASPATGGW